MSALRLLLATATLLFFVVATEATTANNNNGNGNMTIINTLWYPVSARVFFFADQSQSPPSTY